MHVTWRRQELSSGPNGTGVSLVAVLMESYQEAGRPKEKFIEELAAIRERYLTTKARDTRAFHQGLFWVVVDKKLDALNLESVERTTIEAEILKRVPRPNQDWALWGVTCIPRYDA
jgi:hypothetical protein